MKRLSFVQGSTQWHAHRATARNASEVSSVLGCSPYMTRSELLHMRHTGIRPEVGPEQQRRYDDGHAIEAAQKPGAEKVIGEGLYAVVGSEVVEGIELSASFDGLTMAEDIGYECKTVNDDLRAALPYDGEGSEAPNDSHSIPKHYRSQMEQQCMVAGCERILFVAASKDGSEVRRCWYYPDPDLRREILAAWRQFDADLAAYVPPAASTVEKVVAEPVEALPAVSVVVEGSLVVRENFGTFQQRLMHFLDHDLIRTPKSDQDFATLDAQIKEMKAAEEALQRAEAQMLAQIQSVDQAKKTKDMLAKLVRDNRLMAEKLLAAEKERRKGELVAEAIHQLKAHIDALNARLGRPYMPATASAADFGGAIKGLKTISSMEDKLATALANAKIAANEIADRIDANLKHLRDHAGEFKHLFPDAAAIVLKAPDDLQALVSSRIAQHKDAEERRLDAERARIRQEEEARAAAKLRQEQEAAAREQRQREEQEARERRQSEEAVALAKQSDHDRINEEGAQRLLAEAAALAPALTANVHPLPTRAPAVPASPPTLKLGEINARLAPLSIDAAGLAALGFPHSGPDRAAKLYHEHQFHDICAAIAQHVVAVANGQKAVA